MIPFSLIDFLLFFAGGIPMVACLLSLLISPIVTHTVSQCIHRISRESKTNHIYTRIFLVSGLGPVGWTMKLTIE